MPFARHYRIACIVPIALMLYGMLSGGAARADVYDDARAAIDRKDYQQARQLLIPAAYAGDRRAQFALGLMYGEGQGAGKSPVTALRWLRKSAEQGYGPAQFDLGNAYQQGRGTQPDMAEAVRWWQRAARQGFERAQYNLGAYWLLGQHEERLQRLGMAWLLEAAGLSYQPAVDLVAKLREIRPDGFEDQGWLFEPEASEVRILAGSPTAFLIQLYASPNRDAVRAFLDKEGLRGKALLFRFPRKGALWLGVAYGSYPDKAACVNAIRRLRASLRANHPWARSFTSVQELIGSVQAVGD